MSDATERRKRPTNLSLSLSLDLVEGTRRYSPDLSSTRSWS